MLPKISYLISASKFNVTRHLSNMQQLTMTTPHLLKTKDYMIRQQDTPQILSLPHIAARSHFPAIPPPHQSGRLSRTGCSSSGRRACSAAVPQGHGPVGRHPTPADTQTWSAPPAAHALHPPLSEPTQTPPPPPPAVHSDRPSCGTSPPTPLPDPPPPQRRRRRIGSREVIVQMHRRRPPVAGA